MPEVEARPDAAGPIVRGHHRRVLLEKVVQRDVVQRDVVQRDVVQRDVVQRDVVPKDVVLKAAGHEATKWEWLSTPNECRNTQCNSTPTKTESCLLRSLVSSLRISRKNTAAAMKSAIRGSDPRTKKDNVLVVADPTTDAPLDDRSANLLCYAVRLIRLPESTPLHWTVSRKSR
jgi:hypothetical protein